MQKEQIEGFMESWDLDESAHLGFEEFCDALQYLFQEEICMRVASVSASRLGLAPLANV